jgi:hypothetical protein
MVGYGESDSIYWINDKSKKKMFKSRDIRLVVSDIRLIDVIIFKITCDYDIFLVFFFVHSSFSGLN